MDWPVIKKHPEAVKIAPILGDYERAGRSFTGDARHALAGFPDGAGINIAERHYCGWIQRAQRGRPRGIGRALRRERERSPSEHCTCHRVSRVH